MLICPFNSGETHALSALFCPTDLLPDGGGVGVPMYIYRIIIAIDAHICALYIYYTRIGVSGAILVLDNAQ